MGDIESYVQPRTAAKQPSSQPVQRPAARDSSRDSSAGEQDQRQALCSRSRLPRQRSTTLNDVQRTSDTSHSSVRAHLPVVNLLRRLQPHSHTNPVASVCFLRRPSTNPRIISDGLPTYADVHPVWECGYYISECLHFSIHRSSNHHLQRVKPHLYLHTDGHRKHIYLLSNSTYKHFCHYQSVFHCYHITLRPLLSSFRTPYRHRTSAYSNTLGHSLSLPRQLPLTGMLTNFQ